MLEITLFFILSFIALIVLGISLENRRNKQLKKDFLSYNCRILLLTDSEESIDFRVGKKSTHVVVVSPEEMKNRGSFCYRIMKKTGVQRLPMEVWLSTRGDLEAKYMKHRNEI